MSVLIPNKDFEKVNADLARNATPTPPPTPGIFDSGRPVLNQVANSVGRASLQLGITAGVAGEGVAKTIDEVFDTDYQKVWDKYAVEPQVEAFKQGAPDPRTSGVAVQILDSLTTIALPAVATGGIGAGVLTGVTEGAVAASEGVDALTAARSGLVTGLTNLAGVTAPAAVGKTLLQKIGSGAAINLGIGIPSDYAKATVLENGGYTAQASQYKWNDTNARLIDTVLGATFGVLARGSQRVDTRALLGELIPDGALRANLDRHIYNASHGIAVNPGDLDAHVTAFYQNLDLAKRGDALTETPGLYDKNLDKPYDPKPLPDAEKPTSDSNTIVNAADDAGAKTTTEGAPDTLALETDPFVRADDEINTLGDFELPDPNGEGALSARQVLDEVKLQEQDANKISEALSAAVECVVGGGTF